VQGLSRTALQILSIPAADPAVEQVEISDLQYVGSYNWVESTSPTIIVPGKHLCLEPLLMNLRFVGSPREWLDKPTPYQVHADDGVSFCDQNGFRCPSSVLLPLLTAVERTTEADGKTFE